LNGIKLPRDSCKQAEVGIELSDNWQDWETGDLVFYSFYRNQITHVAIVVGEGIIIHSSGFVRFNSMRESDAELYNPRLSDAFVKACRILE
jgi:cell wall-associated NlpC family hydrolase